MQDLPENVNENSISNGVVSIHLYPKKRFELSIQESKEIQRRISILHRAGDCLSGMRDAEEMIKSCILEIMRIYGERVGTLQETNELRKVIYACMSDQCNRRMSTFSLIREAIDLVSPEEEEGEVAE